MQPSIDAGAFFAWLESGIGWLFNELLTTTNIVYTAMQIPAVVATGFAAWWVHDFVHPLLLQRIERSSVNAFSQMMLCKLASLVLPLLWLLGLTLAMGLAAKFGWPYNVVRVAINLLAAWIVIWLASIAVRNPLWSRVIMVAAYAVAVLNILHLLTPTLSVLDSLSVTFGNLRVSVLTVLRGMLSLSVLLWVAMLASGILERRIQRLPNFTPSVQVLIGKLFKATVITIAIVVSLAGVGIDLTAIAVFSGAVGVGIGFGLQKVVSNLISGIIVLMDRSIKPGDIIQVGDTYGWVSSLGARYVAIETRDGTEFLIPNEDVVTKQVTNWTHRDDLVRLKAKVPVSFKTDVPRALELMTTAAAKLPRVLREPKPTALMLGFGDHAIHLELRFWISDAQNGVRNVTSEVLLEILQLFHQHGIEIPLPQRDVHILGGMADRPPAFREPAPT
ncbi:mechanosensitive ion channel protein MscS [Microvirga sp. KLBC 81]|uniref:mechanosensitive ion channel family protein n=1 Tax=Microvirga sp. KLBC 81 TaxID=1862707 RepID=UPI000D5248BF|nr:mechanosensitive ion channel domain-containing protein [Microvirga sp. KLBC 81]PVE21774.1 mechanosensitive ion channel protein MscS [Microvirga sp. KLBC 81]